MGAVLGIDAAWTRNRPSGLALVVENSGGWHLIDARSGSLPEVTALLNAVSKQCGCAVDLVAVDMPLAYSRICGRRFADDKVSEAYGARKCGTYTPNAARPGKVSDALTECFARNGYPLRTETIKTPGLIEVYPHPALVELTCASERLPYKVSKVRAYWPSATPSERRTLLYRQWEKIIASLEREIAGVKAALPQLGMDAPGVEMKAYEDKLDAIICAWVGICALEGRAKPYGNDDAAIWIPKPRVAVSSAVVPVRRRLLRSALKRRCSQGDCDS